MAVPALARSLLSERPSDIALARALHEVLRHRRAEQSFLPAARAEDLRAAAPRGARRIPLRRQAEPLQHPHQAPAERTRQRRTLVRDDVRPRTEGRGRARAAAAADEIRPGASRAVLPAGIATSPAARARTARQLLVHERSAGASPAATGRAGDRGDPALADARRGHRRLRLPAFSRTGAALRLRYTDEALRMWAERIKGWRAELRDVFAYFNNDEQAFAVKN